MPLTGISLVVQRLKSVLAMQGEQVRPLARELSSHVPRGEAKTKNKRKEKNTLQLLFKILYC